MINIHHELLPEFLGAQSVLWQLHEGSTKTGFTIHRIDDPGWLFYENGACLIMAGECRDAMPARDIGDHSYVAYLVVDDVDAYHARVVAAGSETLKPLRDEPWGMREFGVRTVDGHRLMIGSPRPR
jgi:folate-dependent phosphoribosylglycinamide formyltransferase PurN